jgi:hypothetical protein
VKATTLPLFQDTVLWGWRGRYTGAHAYAVLTSGTLAPFCTIAPTEPTTTGTPSRRRCAHCLSAIHRASTRREGTPC